MKVVKSILIAIGVVVVSVSVLVGLGLLTMYINFWVGISIMLFIVIGGVAHSHYTSRYD